MSSYRSTLRYLYGLQYRGMKFGLRNIRALLASVGHPQRAFPSIHVAGTNGKGSTSSFIASAFTEGGYRTGLYTSPHLVRFTERIRIDGREMKEERLVEYVRLIRPEVERTGATFFEATTCAAFLYFADEGVDIAVIEAGLGGRLDATNVLVPLVSVITNISLEHTDILGTTVRAIAREKAGIIKPSVPVVTGSEDGDALLVLRRKARSCGVRLLEARRSVKLQEPAGGCLIGLSTGRFRLRPFRPGLPGRHQYRNAGLALAAIDLALKRKGAGEAFSLLMAPRVVRRGFERVVANTGLEGRLQRLGGRILLDVAHNPAGMRTLVDELKEMKLMNLIVVFGVMRDKEYGPMLDALSGVTAGLIAVAPSLRRALSPRQLVKEAGRRGIAVTLGGSVANGVRKSLRMRGKGRILVTGSHYVVGEALRALEGENA